MSYKVIIAEKPSVAGSIAKIVGATTPHREKANGYLEGNGYRVTWAFGHLVGLDRPEDMGFPGETLPIFPEKWKTHVIQSDKGDSAAIVKKQMKTIESLFKGASEIIVATDAGREGELIFRYIYEYLGCSTPFRRLWISSLTDEAIRDGMKNLLPGSQMDALSQAAHARSEADYLVGFNASRALRLSSGYKGNLSLGRVQTPVLCMIVDRYLQNKNFVPKPFWQISASVHKDMTNFDVLSKRKYDNEQEARDDEKRVASSKQMRVVSVEKKRVNTKPPLLYDLTELQRQANSKHGLTAEETLKVAQSLYEQKYISYPRTGSRFIPEDVYKTIPSLITKLKGYARFKDAAAMLEKAKLCRRSVDDSKVTDHHALLPTDVVPTGLSGNEKTIYEMVAGRMLEAFGEDAVADRTSVELDCEGVRFTATGSVPVKAGWKSVFGVEDEKEKKDGNAEDDQPDSGRLPEMKENEILPAGAIKTVRKETKPLPIYTESSLLGDMQTCGKKIEDEELREAMKDVGLGTPATRAAIIETLLKRNYVARQAKKLIPTELGESIATTVKGRKIADVQTTGEWERELSRIEKGSIQKEQFDEAIKRYVLEIIEDLRKNCTSLQGMSTSSEPTRTCPCCGQTMKNLKFTVTCDAENGGCGFKIYREVAKKKLPQSAIDALAAGKETALIKGFKTKEGKSFDRKLTVNKTEKKIEFVRAATAAQGPALEGLICPCCGDTLADDPWKLKSACGFTLYKEQGGVALKEEQIKTLLSGGKVPLKGLTGKTGKKYNATLFVNTDEKKLDRTFDNKK